MRVEIVGGDWTSVSCVSQSSEGSTGRKHLAQSARAGMRPPVGDMAPHSIAHPLVPVPKLLPGARAHLIHEAQPRMGPIETGRLLSIDRNATQMVWNLVMRRVLGSDSARLHHSLPVSLRMPNLLPMTSQGDRRARLWNAGQTLGHRFIHLVGRSLLVVGI